MKNEIEFSIIIPTKNRIDLLTRAIESLKNQTFKRFETIVINDGDYKDLTLIKKLLEPLNNAGVIQNKNQGVSNARNLGMHNAKAPFLIFLDDDEVFTKDHLMWIYGYLSKTGKKAVVIKSGTQIFKDNILQKEGKFNNNESLEEQIWKYGASMSDFCFPIKIRVNFKFDKKLELLEDFSFLIKVLSKFQSYFLGSYSVIIPDHSARTSYKKFENPAFFYSRELKAINDTARITNVVDSLIRKKVIRTTLAYLKHAIKKGMIISACRIIFEFIKSVLQARKSQGDSTKT